MKMNVFVGVVVVAVAGVLGWQFLHTVPKHNHAVPTGSIVVDVQMPVLSTAAQKGEAIFNEHCIACHGQNGSGVDGSGPPLIHVIYEPSHHSDITFHMAAEHGVRSHHWRFGDMPPVEDVSRDEVSAVIGYIREIQRANGIE